MPQDTQDFALRLSSDFVDQLVDRMRKLKLRQSDLCERMGVSQPRMSGLLNNSSNMQLQTMVKAARALGAKITVVLYDDGDAENCTGPIHSDVFRIAWEKMGRPPDFLSLVKESGPLTDSKEPV
jgi:transcriptional regulator with XRE-family HTH domain